MAQHTDLSGFSSTFCLSGGCGLNVQANQQLRSRSGYDDVWVFPACSDSGIPYGLALQALHQTIGPKYIPERRINNIFWGPKRYSKSVEWNVCGISPQKTRYSEIASLLSKGAVLGVCAGRSEVGPRALGHRSIFADARGKDIRERINAVIKGRELWRPFAPIVLEKASQEYFEDSRPSPFMLFANRVISRESLPAIVHEDGTARVQTVGNKNSPFVNKLLTEFHRETGTAVLLNTSFNRAGEPIVETKLDAILTFLNSGLDGVVVQDGIVLRSNLSAAQIEDARHDLVERREIHLNEMLEKAKSSLVQKRKPRAFKYMNQKTVDRFTSDILSQYLGRPRLHIIGSQDEISRLKSNFEVTSGASFSVMPATAAESKGMTAARDLILKCIEKHSQSEVVLLAWFELEPFVLPLLQKSFGNRIIRSIYPTGWTGPADNYFSAIASKKLKNKDSYRRSRSG
jgi:hypothetical protein